MKLDLLRRLREKLDPFELSAAIDRKLAIIWKLAAKSRLQRADKPTRKPYWKQHRPDLYAMPTEIFLPLRNITLERISKQWAFEKMHNHN